MNKEENLFGASNFLNEPQNSENENTFEDDKENSNKSALEMFCAGFNQCSQEAIRYLIETENLPEDHPLVIGLKQHLALQEAYYLIEMFKNEQDQHANDDLPSYEQAIEWLRRNDDSDYYSEPNNSQATSPSAISPPS